MSKPRVYRETTIVSYLAARPSGDEIVRANQQLTTFWWKDRRMIFDVFISQILLQEIRAGDPQAAQRREELVAGIPVLDLTPMAYGLSEELLRSGAIPLNAEVDAFHIAIAATGGMHYLLTWNCRHIANARSRKQIEGCCRSTGFEPPIICTPQQLME